MAFANWGLLILAFANWGLLILRFGNCGSLSFGFANLFKSIWICASEDELTLAVEHVNDLN